MKPFRFIAAAAAAMLVAGCINLEQDAELSLSPDDTVTGVISTTVSYDLEMLEESGEEPEFLIDDEEVADANEELREDGYETILFELFKASDDPADPHGLNIVMDNTPFVEFNRLMDEISDSPDFFIVMRLERDGDLHRVEGELLSPEEAEYPNPESDVIDEDPFENPFAEVVTVVEVTFAGDIEQTSGGEVDGRTITWAKPGKFRATAGASPDVVVEPVEPVEPEVDDPGVEEGDEGEEDVVEGGDDTVNEGEDVTGDAVEDDDDVADEGDGTVAPDEEPAEDKDVTTNFVLLLLLVLFLVGVVLFLHRGRKGADGNVNGPDAGPGGPEGSAVS